MKKVLLFLCLLIALIFSLPYFLISKTLIVTNIITLPCSISAANRILQQKNNWEKFWPGKTQLTTQNLFTNDDYLFYNDYTFSITKVLQNILFISIASQNNKVNTNLVITSQSSDSLVLNWSYATQTSINPIIRIKQYQQAVHTKKTMQYILSVVKQFLSKDENIYGFDIVQMSTKDTLLVSTKITTKAYPSTAQIYSLIEKLKNNVEASNVKQTGFPMININQIDKLRYSLMVAIPVNKIINGKNDILYQRLIPGRFLTTTAIGGEKTVDIAYNSLQQYIQDYGRITMAAPFMYLITDRSKETDTLQWITKLYFPIM